MQQNMLTNTHKRSLCLLVAKLQSYNGIQSPYQMILPNYYSCSHNYASQAATFPSTIP